MKLLAISGSLRQASSSSTLLRAAARLAPHGLTVEVYEGLGELPHFNPDLDGEGAIAPTAVADLRDRIDDADGLLICSPEYAHGVPGTLKNALDWLVSSPVIIGKPVALVNPSARATYAHASLLEILTVMSMKVIEATVSLDGRKSLDESGIVANADLSAMLERALTELARSIEEST